MFNDIEGLEANIRHRDEDLTYAKQRIDELEGYINQLRRDVQARDDKLDQVCLLWVAVETAVVDSAQ